MSDRERLRLDDGRILDVRVTGPEGGTPLVFHHGTPGSHVPVRRLERAAHARGLRLVAASRPGYGDSTRRGGRDVVDVVEDIRAVLASLGADRCLVAGWSGGGPHALACAARLASAAAVLVIAGVAPSDAEGLDWMAGMGEENVTEFGAALAGEPTLRAYLGPVREHLMGVTIEGIVSAFATLLPEVDREVLTDEFGEDMRDGLREGLRLTAEGWLDDDLAFTRGWGFELDEVAVPTAIWQGSEDLMVPFPHGRWLAAHVPGAVAHLEAGEGHLSIGLGAIDRMLDELMEMADSTTG